MWQEYKLRLFGQVSLAGPTGALTGRVSQRHRLALLVLLGRSPGGRCSRGKLRGYLWPESDSIRARHLLNVSVHELRKALGGNVLLSENYSLRLNTDVIRVDVSDFEAALGEGELERAVGICVGRFLDGFYLPSAPEFERWTDSERRRLANLKARALEELAAEAECCGDYRAAVQWWRRLGEEDPYSSRIVLRLMQVLVAAGDCGGALEQARVHETFLRREFGADLEPAIAEMVGKLTSRGSS